MHVDTIAIRKLAYVLDAVGSSSRVENTAISDCGSALVGQAAHSASRWWSAELHWATATVHAAAAGARMAATAWEDTDNAVTGAAVALASPRVGAVAR
jgi:hypothetical protein